MALEFLFNGAPPQSVTASMASQSGLPDWYQEYLRGIAGKATEVAGQGYQQYPGQRLAGFNQDQQNSFDTVRQSQGGWQPMLQGALGAASQALPTASAFLGAGAQYGDAAVGQAGQAGQQANQAVAGSAPQWTNNWQQYMSPYTSGVVNEIARLGNQNLNENVLPGINNSFIGNGGFGSTRNAEMIGRGIRDSQRDITGAQSMALQQGYGTSANIFNQDATRFQGQQGLQANTALQAGQLGANAGLQAGSMANAAGQIGAAAADQSAQRFGALGQLQQNLGYQDAGALGAIGGAQQGLQQQGMDMGYQNFNEQKQYNWDTLGNLNSVLRGMQLPQSQTQVTNQPYGNVGTSPLQWANMLYGLGGANGATKQGT